MIRFGRRRHVPTQDELELEAEWSTFQQRRANAYAEALENVVEQNCPHCICWATAVIALATVDEQAAKR